MSAREQFRSIAAGQVPVLDLDLLHDKARVRLEREPPPPEAPSAPPSPSPSDVEQASTSAVAEVELESLREALSAHPGAMATLGQGWTANVPCECGGVVDRGGGSSSGGGADTGDQSRDTL